MSISDEIRAITQTIRSNLHARDAIADGLELIAQALDAQPAAVAAPAAPKVPAKKTAKKSA